MTTTPTEESVKSIVAEIAAKAEADAAEKMKGWPKEASSAVDRLMGIVSDQVTTFLSGDITALREALVRDVSKLIATGKSPVAKAYSDLA